MTKRKDPVKEFALDAMVYRLNNTLTKDELREKFIAFVEGIGCYCAVEILDVDPKTGDVIPR